MAKREIPPLHEVAVLERKYRLFQLLQDLGIKSAKAPCNDIWLDYMFILSQIEMADDGVCILPIE